MCRNLLNPTVAGLFAVVVWGLALPMARMLEEQISILGYCGFMYSGVGILGYIANRLQKQPWPVAAFVNPYFYARGVFFVLHDAFQLTSILLIQKRYLPFVILLNYLWPTAAIVCSVLIAGVKVTRWWAFVGGSAIVALALSIEILTPGTLSTSLFARFQDCVSYALMFMGAISWGLYSALSRRFGAETGGGAVTPIFQLTLALALPFSFLPVFNRWDHINSSLTLALIGYVILQFLAYRSWDFGVRNGNFVILSLCADFIPWLSLLAAHNMLSIFVDNRTVLSALLVVIGGATTRYGTRN